MRIDPASTYQNDFLCKPYSFGNGALQLSYHLLQHSTPKLSRSLFPSCKLDEVLPKARHSLPDPISGAALRAGSMVPTLSQSHYPPGAYLNLETPRRADFHRTITPRTDLTKDI